MYCIRSGFPTVQASANNLDMPSMLTQATLKFIFQIHFDAVFSLLQETAQSPQYCITISFTCFDLALEAIPYMN